MRRESEDPYFLALSALALGDPDALLEKLAALQEKDGSLTGTRTSITASRGRNLTVETTALATMAFLRGGRVDEAAAAALFLTGARRGGGDFGATQATILAMTALLEHSRTVGAHEACTVAVHVNGRAVAERTIPQGANEVVAITDEFARALVPGGNRIELRSPNRAGLPFTLGLTYMTRVPPADPDCAVGVVTALSRNEIDEGRSLDLTVTLTNREQNEVPMTVARVGLPAGLVPRTARLEELKEAGEIAFFETRPERGDPLPARPEVRGGATHRPRPDGRHPRRVRRPGHLGLPLLRRRPEGLDRAPQDPNRPRRVRAPLARR